MYTFDYLFLFGVHPVLLASTCRHLLQYWIIWMRSGLYRPTGLLFCNQALVRFVSLIIGTVSMFNTMLHYIFNNCIITQICSIHQLCNRYQIWYLWAACLCIYAKQSIVYASCKLQSKFDVFHPSGQHAILCAIPQIDWLLDCLQFQGLIFFTILVVKYMTVIYPKYWAWVLVPVGNQNPDCPGHHGAVYIHDTERTHGNTQGRF